jgi:hypothetical protein
MCLFLPGGGQGVQGERVCWQELWDVHRISLNWKLHVGEKARP